MTFENQKIMPMIEINEDESVSGEINHVDSIDSEAIDKDNQPIITKCKGRSKNISYPYHSKYDCLQEADDTITHSDGFLGFKWKQKRQEPTPIGATRWYRCLEAGCPKLLQLRIDTIKDLCTLGRKKLISLVDY